MHLHEGGPSIYAAAVQVIGATLNIHPLDSSVRVTVTSDPVVPISKVAVLEEGTQILKPFLTDELSELHVILSPPFTVTPFGLLLPEYEFPLTVSLS